jgi:transcriptional regulator with XRE-family HTH domain
MSNYAVSGDIAGRLRLLQTKHGLTLQEMADRCGLPKRSLENYMKPKDAQRPGVDALLGIADGLKVSIDWIVGRSDEPSSPAFGREDYAVFCQSAVLHVLIRILDAVKADPTGAIDVEAGRIMGYELHDVAAVAMLDFMAISELQAGHPSRPKDYFKRRFASLSDMALSGTGTTSVMDIKERKL